MGEMFRHRVQVYCLSRAVVLGRIAFLFRSKRYCLDAEYCLCLSPGERSDWKFSGKHARFSREYEDLDIHNNKRNVIIVFLVSCCSIPGHCFRVLLVLMVFVGMFHTSVVWSDDVFRYDLRNHGCVFPLHAFDFYSPSHQQYIQYRGHTRIWTRDLLICSQPL